MREEDYIVFVDGIKSSVTCPKVGDRKGRSATLCVATTPLMVLLSSICSHYD